MAEVFKSFTNKVTNLAKEAKVKVKELTDITKLKIELKTKESDLDECFEKLGRAYFFDAKKLSDNSEKMSNLVLVASALSQEIIELKEAIALAQNKKICPHCGSLKDNDAPYCKSCGQKVVAVKKQPVNAEPSEEKAEE